MKKALFRLPPEVYCTGRVPNIDISGPQGQISLYIPIKFIQRGQSIRFARALKISELSVFKQAIHGVSLLYKVSLSLQGIGYRAEQEDNFLVLKLGYSHGIKIQVPDVIRISINKNNINFYSAHLIKLNNFVSTVRKFRFPDTYKGGGILYVGETISKKEGKKT